MPSWLDALNRECTCPTLVPERLPADVRRYFATLPVYVSRADIAAMRRIVDAIEEITRAPAYRERVLSRATDLGRREEPTLGVCFGYDFHLTADGPKLIEVNTNAGGAMLGAVLTEAQLAACKHTRGRVRAATNPVGLATRFLDMFLKEWSGARGNAPLRRIAIVDDAPEEQFLYREFELYAELFRRHGFDCVICDPRQLSYRDGALFCEGEPIDFVYNRLVDFTLDEPRHAALRAAHAERRVVVTPHPRAHALYADKRNLVEFGSETLWNEAQLGESPREALAGGIPETRVVAAAEAEALWRERKSWFFKPMQGYGSKAAYRGDKLTRSTFAEILTRDYVAQRIVLPQERWVAVDGTSTALKYDLRCFVYEGRVQLLVARLYQGQTTNFRTPGGGFASVFSEVEGGHT